MHLLLLICSYQYGPDTYLLQVKDATFPARLREYLNVARTTSADFQDCKVRRQRGLKGRKEGRKEASYFRGRAILLWSKKEPVRKLILKWQAVVDPWSWRILGNSALEIMSSQEVNFPALS